MSERLRTLVGCINCKRGFPLRDLHCYDRGIYLCDECEAEKERRDNTPAGEGEEG